MQNNLIHGSDSADNAKTEIALWFKPDELVDWRPADAPWIAGLKDTNGREPECGRFGVLSA